MGLRQRQIVPATDRQPDDPCTRKSGHENMLKLRSIDLSDFAVLEGKQRIGRIRLATERMPCVWHWSVTIHLTGGLPMGSSPDLATAQAEFKAAWKELKARTSREPRYPIT
jgi:hypothetical protein